MFSKIDEFIDGMLKSGVPFCDMAIYHKGKEVYRRTEGALDMDGLVTARGDERYNVYSASKVITCTAALMLCERGLISLEDNLSSYMPEFEKMQIKCDTGVCEAKNPITVRHLFSMTSGIPYDVYSPSLKRYRRETDGRCPTRLLPKYLALEPLVCEPGERWEYGLSHDLLAALIEIITGEKFGEFVKENIFTPLGMEHTTFSHDEDTVDKLAPQYNYNQNLSEPVPCAKRNIYNFGSEYEAGGAGCITTLDDYMRFLEGLRLGRLISLDTLDLMAKNQIDESSRDSFWLYDMGYGYGLGVRCPRDSSLSDFGWGGAAGAFFMIDREKEISAIFLQHVLSAPIEPYKSNLGSVISGIFD